MTQQILELRQLVLVPSLCFQLGEKTKSQHWHSPYILQSKAILIEEKALLHFHVLYPGRSEVAKSLSQDQMRDIASSQIHHKSEELHHMSRQSHGRHVEL